MTQYRFCPLGVIVVQLSEQRNHSRENVEGLGLTAATQVKSLICFPSESNTKFKHIFAVSV